MNIIILVLTLIVAFVINFIVIRKYVTAPLQALTKDFEPESAVLTKLILDVTPLSCNIWDKNFNIIDCNDAAANFFGLKSKQEYVKRYFELSPDNQSNGQPSDDKFKEHLRKAFTNGSDTFDWTHKLLNGELIPTEIVLVRIKIKDDLFLVVGYTSDLRRIEGISERVAGLENVTDKIYYDQLTGIYNKRYFEEAIEQHIKALSRPGGKVSLLKIDVDSFKLYNDTYGYMKGDECLRAIAVAISDVITRSDDFAARFGGGEFVVVLPNTNESGARFIAHKVLEAVRALNIPHEKNPEVEHVTVSVGITTGNASHIQATSSYVNRADEMLHKAKQGGRNKYVYGSLVS